MRLLLRLGIAIALAWSVEAGDLAGTWKGSMDTQIGKTEVVIAFKPGPAVTGTVKMEAYEGLIEKGKLAGDRISFEVNIEPGKVTFEGVVAGDEIRFTVTGTQGDKYSLICARQK